MEDEIVPGPVGGAPGAHRAGEPAGYGTPSAGAGRWLAPWAVGAVALALRWWMPGETILTTDEAQWMARSRAFGHALRSGDLAAMSAGRTDLTATRPGITTMWTGELALRVTNPVGQAWHGLGLGPEPSSLRIAHLLVALWCSLGLVALTSVARRLVGTRPALVAGGLLAVEPLLVGHSAILHTDALVTTYASLAVVALVAALEAARLEGAEHGPPDLRPTTPDPGAAADLRHPVASARSAAPSTRLAVLAGVAAAIALLTKLNSVVLVGAVLPVLLVVHVAAPGIPAPSRRRAARVLGAFAAVTVVAVVVPWPSLWVDPLGQLRALRRTADLADRWTSLELLLGRVSTGVDRRFYPVAAWYRSSAWLLLGSVAAVSIAGVRAVRRHPGALPRRVAVALAVPPLAYLLVLLVSAKHYDRYLLPLLPFGALAIGVVVGGFLDRAGEARWVGRAGWGALAAAAWWTGSLAPFALSHVDPVVGGQRAALTRFPLGWNEGIEQLLGRTHARTGGCPTIAGRRWLVGQPGGCWTHVRWEFLDGSSPPPEFVLIYVADRQRGITVAEDAYVREHAVLVDAVVIDGVAYAELWHPTG